MLCVFYLFAFVLVCILAYLLEVWLVIVGLVFVRVGTLLVGVVFKHDLDTWFTCVFGLL